MVSLLSVRENNSCLKCGSITEVLFRNKDRVPFLRCIEGACKNMQDMNATKSSTGKRGAKNNGRNIDEGIEEEERYCPDHKVLLKLRRGRRGPFYGCPKYPKCKHTENP